MSEGMINIVSAMIMLLLIMAAGYTIKKIKLITESTDKGLTKVVLNVTLPAMLLASVLDADEIPTPDQLISTGFASCASFALLIVMAFVVTFVLRIHRGSQGAFRFMTVFGNIGFMGFPVVSAVYGNAGIIYASVFQLPFNILVYTLGIYFLTQDNERGVKIKINPKMFLSPAFVSSLLTLAFVIIGVHSVPVLGPALSTLGDMTTPAALIILGSSLANMPLRDLFGGWKMWVCSLMRLIVTPLLTWVLLGNFITEPIVLGITIVLAGMPAATNGTMLAYEYGGNTKAISQGIFITTILSLFTIPLLMAVIG